MGLANEAVSICCLPNREGPPARQKSPIPTNGALWKGMAILHLLHIEIEAHPVMIADPATKLFVFLVATQSDATGIYFEW
jgi:hypothetical protein